MSDHDHDHDQERPEYRCASATAAVAVAAASPFLNAGAQVLKEKLTAPKEEKPKVELPRGVERK